MSQKWKIRLSLWVPLILWALVIFSFSSRPTGIAFEVHWKDFIIKKTAHIIEYSILAVLALRAFRGEKKTSQRAYFYAFILTAFYATTDEFHQAFTPGREPTLRDILIDTCGAALTLICIKNLLPKAPPRLKTLGSTLGLI